MHIKKFNSYIFLILRKNPILISLLVPIGGGILYFCGHLLIASYLLGANFDFIEFVLDPLPIPYGHIIAAGTFILVLITTSIFLVTYTVYLIEIKESFRAVALLISLFMIVFLITNVYSLNPSSHFNYKGVAVLVVFLILWALIITFVYAALNPILGLTTFTYGWNIFVVLALFFSFDEFIDLGVLLVLGLFVLFWILFSGIYILKKVRKGRIAVGVLSFPFCFTITLIIIALCSSIFTVPTAVNLICIATMTVFLTNVCLKYIKTPKSNFKFKTIFEEIRETGNNVNILLSSSLVTLILMLILPYLVIYTGKSFNEFSNPYVSHKIETENGAVEGRYLGQNNGLHYYIEDNRLYRTKEVINISPK